MCVTSSCSEISYFFGDFVYFFAAFLEATLKLGVERVHNETVCENEIWQRWRTYIHAIHTLRNSKFRTRNVIHVKTEIVFHYMPVRLCRSVLCVCVSYIAHDSTILKWNGYISRFAFLSFKIVAMRPACRRIYKTLTQSPTKA